MREKENALLWLMRFWQDNQNVATDTAVSVFVAGF
jgi:hypothetical protein